MRLFIFLCLLITTINLSAEEITLPSGQDILVHEKGNADTKYHALWLPSHRGFSKSLMEIADASADKIHILMPDLHESYFLSQNQSSLDNVPQKDLDDLIKHYAKQYEKLFLIGQSRSAELILNTTRRLQQQDKVQFAGLVFISPYLQNGAPEIGKTAEYLQTAFHSNLPIYIFQPQRTTRFVPAQGLVKALQKGGSEVYFHVLKDVGGGYLSRPKQHRKDNDEKARQQFPNQLNKALSILQMTDAAPIGKFVPDTKTKRKVLSTNLHEVDIDTPSLELSDLSGKRHNLNDYKDKIVVVSFWASWCAPCLEEMPSLVKLKEKHKDKLEILAVNILEEKQTIEKFTKAMQINFPILQDTDSKAVERWKVYVYPSNFILDKAGKIRYAVSGAIDWQKDEVEAILQKM